MSGKWRSVAALALVALVVSVPASWAAEKEEDEGWEERVEITPFIGYRIGGDLPYVEGAARVSIPEGTSYGLMLDFKVYEGGFIEVRYSVQKTELDATNSPLGPGQVKVTDLDVEHYFIGGTYEWETSTMALPFVSADLGGVRFDAPGFHARTSFAFSLGGGVKLPLAKHVGLRFDGRWVSAFINGNTDLYCDSAGFCIVVSDGTYFGQLEVSGGVTFKF
jgi:opacity protein-like surface antigen